MQARARHERPGKRLHLPVHRQAPLSPLCGGTSEGKKAINIKAITIKQPWASLIALGVKHIETRSWATKYRGPIAIHAGLAKPPKMFACCQDVGDYVMHRDHEELAMRRRNVVVGDWDDLPLGAVIATAELTDCLPIYDDPGDWRDGSCLVNSGEILVCLGERQFDGEGGSTIPGDDVTGALPYGDFTPGRYGWMLTNITPTTPTPAKGQQRLWNWNESTVIA